MSIWLVHGPHTSRTSRSLAVAVLASAAISGFCQSPIPYAFGQGIENRDAFQASEFTCRF
jgi:hypothetical protein